MDQSAYIFAFISLKNILPVKAVIEFGMDEVGCIVN